jgi:hypothetical protein
LPEIASQTLRECGRAVNLYGIETCSGDLEYDKCPTLQDANKSAVPAGSFSGESDLTEAGAAEPERSVSGELCWNQSIHFAHIGLVLHLMLEHRKAI